MNEDFIKIVLKGLFIAISVITIGLFLSEINSEIAITIVLLIIALLWKL